jgi:hypothetical protein
MEVSKGCDRVAPCHWGTSHSPHDSSSYAHRVTPKHAHSDPDAAKKRKWSVGHSNHVTPNPNPSPEAPLAPGITTSTTIASQKKKKNCKLSQDDGSTLDDIFPKLDTSDPVSARRLQQRRRVVAFGKNTVGYDEYRRQVPIHQRKSKSMDHPSTPDHTLDIPNRRWLGLVKAWYDFSSLIHLDL